MVTALIVAEYINYYCTYNAEILGQYNQLIINFRATHYFFSFSEIGIFSFQAYLTDRKESKGNRQLTYIFLGLLIINFIYMVFLKMYAICIVKRKLSIGKAKIKNLVSFNNLSTLVILTLSAIGAGIVFTRNIVDEENAYFIPIMLSIIGNTLLTSLLVGNKDALEFAIMKCNKFSISWNRKNTIVNKVVPEAPQMINPEQGGQEMIEMIDFNG